MNILKQMVINIDNFTSTDKKIYKALLEFPQLIERDSIAQLASYLKVSPSSIMRFCQKAGYSGYSEFKFEYLKQLNAFNESKQKKSILEFFLSIYTQTLEEIENLDESIFINLCEEIYNSKNTRCVGNGKSSLPGDKLKLNLAPYGKEIISLNDVCLYRDLPKIIQDDDLTIFFSVTARSIGIYECIKECYEFNKKSVLVTCLPDKKILKYVNNVIYIPKKVQNKYLITDSHAMMIIFVDLLSNYYTNFITNQL
jgi:DNA-binding MurR/RpiR family transcriptional regulator